MFICTGLCSMLFLWEKSEYSPRAWVGCNLYGYWLVDSTCGAAHRYLLDEAGGFIEQDCKSTGIIRHLLCLFGTHCPGISSGKRRCAEPEKTEKNYLDYPIPSL